MVVPHTIPTVSLPQVRRGPQEEAADRVGLADSDHWELIIAYASGGQRHFVMTTEQLAVAMELFNNGLNAQPRRRRNRFFRWCMSWWGAFEKDPGWKWWGFVVVIVVAILVWYSKILGKAWLYPYQAGSSTSDLSSAVEMAIVNFVLVFSLALIMYRFAITRGGLTRGGIGSGSVLTRLVLGLGGLAIVALAMVGVFAASYYAYGKFPDFKDQRVAWRVPTTIASEKTVCTKINYPETNGECLVPEPLSPEAAWFASLSIASTVGGAVTPLSNPARVLVGAQMATDLMVLVMLAAVLLGVVRPDKDDELTTGRLVNALPSMGFSDEQVAAVKIALAR